MYPRSPSIIMSGLVLGSLLLVGSPAAAQSVNTSQNPYFEQREANQEERIQQGVDTGALTPGETRYLDRQQGRINRTENRMQADGRLSPGERQRLNQMQNHASRDIYRLKHNVRTADGDVNTYDPRIERREDFQQERIRRGIESGELTRGEARYLNREQERINRAEARMMADGRLDPRERQRLNQMQNQASRDIYRLEHNGRTADGRGGPNHHGWGGPNHHGWNGHPNHGGGGPNHHGGGGPHNYGWGGAPSGAQIERREAYQERQIQRGIESGELTRGEARYLNREQARIDRMEDRFRADGRLDPRERQRLNQMQNQAGRDIYRLEHNNRTADGRQGHNPHYAGNQPGGHDSNRGWHGNGNSGWHGNNTPGNGCNPNNRGWHGNHPGGNGNTPGGPAPVNPGTNGTTTVRGPQGQQGHYARQGQPGAYQQPGAQAGARPGQAPVFQGRQPQPQYQARQPMPQQQPAMRPMPQQQPTMRPMPQQQPTMRAAMPQPNMAARQPVMGGMANRANFPAGGFGGARRR